MTLRLSVMNSDQEIADGFVLIANHLRNEVSSHVAVVCKYYTKQEQTCIKSAEIICNCRSVRKFLNEKYVLMMKLLFDEISHWENVNKELVVAK